MPSAVTPTRKSPRNASPPYTFANIVQVRYADTTVPSGSTPITAMTGMPADLFRPIDLTLGPPSYGTVSRRPKSELIVHLSQSMISRTAVGGHLPGSWGRQG